MDEKLGSGTQESSEESSSAVAVADQPLEKALERLPTQYRNEILKQYELPNSKVSILTIFRYATPYEIALQVIGILMAIVAGTFPI
jgi:hypothetical protein